MQPEERAHRYPGGRGRPGKRCRGQMQRSGRLGGYDLTGGTRVKGQRLQGNWLLRAELSPALPDARRSTDRVLTEAVIRSKTQQKPVHAERQNASNMVQRKSVCFIQRVVSLASSRTALTAERAEAEQTTKIWLLLTSWSAWSNHSGPPAAGWALSFSPLPRASSSVR